jgi:hypothetical protein
MWKRALSAAMWLVLVVWAWNYAAWLFDVPTSLGPVAGVAVALFVGFDPLRLFFQRSRTPTSSRATMARGLPAIE